MKKVLYALVLANTVVLKPSSDTPVVGIKIAELFDPTLTLPRPESRCRGAKMA